MKKVKDENGLEWLITEDGVYSKAPVLVVPQHINDWICEKPQDQYWRPHQPDLGKTKAFSIYPDHFLIPEDSDAKES